MSETGSKESEVMEDGIECPVEIGLVGRYEVDMSLGADEETVSGGWLKR